MNWCFVHNKPISKFCWSCKENERLKNLKAADTPESRVRDLHKAVWHEATNLDGTPWAGWICNHCTGTGRISALTIHPCDTIDALEGK